MSFLNNLRTKYKQGELTKSQYIEQMFVLHSELCSYSDFLKGTDISRIDITGDGVFMTTSSGVVLMMPPRDERSMPVEALNFGSYEKQEFEFMRKMIGKHFTVFDIGANIGWYTLTIAKLFPKTKVFAFEPIPPTFTYLRKNILLNKLTNARAYNFGLSDKRGKLIFYYYPEGSGNASAANLSPESDVSQVACTIKTLDEVARKSSLKVDFVKCDVEGAELFVFQGGIETIKKYKPIIFTEILRKWTKRFHYNPNTIINLLYSLGYRCFVITGDILKEFFTMDENTKETNFFFLHSHKHSSLIKRLVKTTGKKA